MTERKGAVDRRRFLQNAATGALAAAVPDSMHAQDHEHEHQDVPSDPALRTKALESLLVEKGLVDPAALDALVDAFENKIGPRNGARVVARAWIEPAYRKRLLQDGGAAVAEMGFPGIHGEHLVAVENTPKVHNLVVCTLCSCYPRPVLGLPPDWYKLEPYRARAVRDRRDAYQDSPLAIGGHVPHRREVRR